MANEAIYELTQEPSLNAADRFVVQQSNATTRATSATFALMGGLEINAIGTVGNTTATVGTIDVWTMAGEAANRTWTLPGTAQVGERCGIYIVDGDAADEILIHTDATGDKIGNSTGFHSAGTEFTRLFIENECMIFRCVSATNPDWIVEYDGRIPCIAVADDDNTQAFTSSTYETIEAEAELIDRGDIYDSTGFDFTTRRGGVYIASAFIRLPGLDSGEHLATKVRSDPDGTPADVRNINYVVSGVTDLSVYCVGFVYLNATAGDNYDIQARHDEGAEQTTSSTASVTSRVSFQEVL